MFEGKRTCRSRDTPRRVERLHRRQRAVVALDLDQAELSRAPLCETGGAGVSRQHVGVAMHAKRLVRGRIVGIVPSPGRQLDDPGKQSVAQHRTGKAGPAVVVKPHDVAIADTARRGILRMEADRLTAVNL